MNPQVAKVLYKHYRVRDQYHYLLDESIANRRPKESELHRYERHDRMFEPSNRGGKTVCIFVLDNGDSIRGVSYCSLGDNFSYRIGRELAYERACDAYNKAYGE